MLFLRKIFPKKSLNWRTIEIFDPKNLEHQTLGESIIDLCDRLLKMNGKSPSFKVSESSDQSGQYEDDGIVIQGQVSEVDRHLSILGKRQLIGKIKVVWSTANTVVVDWSARLDRGAEYVGDGYAPYIRYHQDLHIFRPGDWIDHINNLKPVLEQAELEAATQKRETESKVDAAKQHREWLEQKQRYGKIENSSMAIQSAFDCNLENTSASSSVLDCVVPLKPGDLVYAVFKSGVYNGTDYYYIECKIHPHIHQKYKLYSTKTDAEGATFQCISDAPEDNPIEPSHSYPRGLSVRLFAYCLDRPTAEAKVKLAAEAALIEAPYSRTAYNAQDPLAFIQEFVVDRHCYLQTCSRLKPAADGELAQ